MTDIQDLSSIPCKEENYYEDINCRSPGVSHAPPSVSTPISSGNCREERREDKLIAWVFYARSQAFLPSKSCLCRSQKLHSCSTNAEMSFSSFAIIFFLFFFLVLEERIPVAFEKQRCCHEVVLDSSSCICQEVSSAVSRTFTTAYEEERSTEVLSSSPSVCSSGLNEPVSPGN